MQPPTTSTVQIAEEQKKRRTSETETLLQAGLVQQAVALGWAGDATTFYLVKSGLGVDTFRVKLRGPTLGFDVTNERGVALVTAVSANSQLRSGDVIREVNGAALFTCEAVVGAIRNATTTYGEVSLGIGRPALPAPPQRAPPAASPVAPGGPQSMPRLF